MVNQKSHANQLISGKVGSLAVVTGKYKWTPLTYHLHTSTTYTFTQSSNHNDKHREANIWFTKSNTQDPSSWLL